GRRGAAGAGRPDGCRHRRVVFPPVREAPGRQRSSTEGMAVMADEADATGTQQFRRQLDDFLSTAAPGLEEVTTSKAFGSMLAQAVGNMVAMHRIGNDVLDLAIRNVRLAGRADV